jgi:hypothetical protein
MGVKNVSETAVVLAAVDVESLETTRSRRSP